VDISNCKQTTDDHHKDTKGAKVRTKTMILASRGAKSRRIVKNWFFLLAFVVFLAFVVGRRWLSYRTFKRILTLGSGEGAAGSLHPSEAGNSLKSRLNDSNKELIYNAAISF